MSTSEPDLLQEEDSGILRLTLNRPERRNALSPSLIDALAAAFTAAARSPEIRVIVLSGTGDKAFCSGADLNPDAGSFGFDYARPDTAYANMLRAARACTVPILGRINGHCLAGGMGLLAICDMAVAAAPAKFGLPEVKVGVFPMQVAALLQTMMPPRPFAEMCYTGEMIDADAALACGLLNRVADPDELDATTNAMAARVAERSPTAIRRGKYALSAMAGMTADQALSFMEAQVGLMPMTEDAREGLAAFAEKRSPQWTGR